MPSAEILSQGDEVVTGQITDTNASWLATELTSLGVDVLRHVTVGDRLKDIASAIRVASERADLVVCTGGLGPTEDDLTAAAAALAFDAPLALDAQALEDLRARYASFGRVMPAVNEKQAWLPSGSTRLDNPRGTAPGFAVQTARGGVVACMPGVPHEMKAMFRDHVVPLAQRLFSLQPPRLVVLRTTGVGESALQERIGRFQHDSVVLAYRTMVGENQIKLRAPASFPLASLESLAHEVSDRIGRAVFAIEGLGDEGGSLAEVVGRHLTAHTQSLACAESCTGGLVSSLCTAVPGASAWFIDGVVAYANATKCQRLGVQQAALEAHGAVSETVARQMAEGARSRANTTYALATTGIAGPGGGSADKPVGTVHIALATPHTTHHRLVRLGGTRSQIQHRAAHAALNLLRLQLQGHLTT